MIPSASVRLVERRHEWPTVWQWVHVGPWEDEVTRTMTDYLAGFATREAAVEYGTRNGWAT